jgi:hypothetical protein
MLWLASVSHITFETNAPPRTTERLIEAKDTFIDLALHTLDTGSEDSDVRPVQPNRVLIAPFIYTDDGEVGYVVESSVDLGLGGDLHITRMQSRFAKVSVQIVRLAGCQGVWMWPRSMDNGVEVRGDAFEVVGEQSRQLGSVAFAYLSEYRKYAELGL